MRELGHPRGRRELSPRGPPRAAGLRSLRPVDPLDAQGFRILGTPQATPSISLSSAAVSLTMTSSHAFWLEGESAGDVVATITWAEATRQVTIHVTQ